MMKNLRSLIREFVLLEMDDTVGCDGSGKIDTGFYTRDCAGCPECRARKEQATDSAGLKPILALDISGTGGLTTKCDLVTIIAGRGKKFLANIPVPPDALLPVDPMSTQDDEDEAIDRFKEFIADAALNTGATHVIADGFEPSPYEPHVFTVDDWLHTP